jgi:hypothetical protein
MNKNILGIAAATFSLSSLALAGNTSAEMPSGVNCQVFDAQGKELIPTDMISGKPSPTSQSLTEESDLFYLDLELLDGTVSLNLTDKSTETSARAYLGNLRVNDSFAIDVVPSHATGPSVILKCTAR